MHAGVVDRAADEPGPKLPPKTSTAFLQLSGMPTETSTESAADEEELYSYAALEQAKTLALPIYNEPKASVADTALYNEPKASVADTALYNEPKASVADTALSNEPKASVADTALYNEPKAEAATTPMAASTNLYEDVESEMPRPSEAPPKWLRPSISRPDAEDYLSAAGQETGLFIVRKRCAFPP